MRLCIVLLLWHLWFSTASAQPPPPSIAVEATCREHLNASTIQTENRQAIEVDLTPLKQNLYNKISLKKVRFYGIISLGLLAGAAGTSYVLDSLPAYAQYLTTLIASISGLFIFNVGAPLFDPMASHLRHKIFRMGEEEKDQTFVEGTNTLEAIWGNTQRAYSPNAAMSRNNVNQFIIGLHANLMAARTAWLNGDVHFAAVQIADAAMRMGNLYRDIPPDEKNVLRTINFAFSVPSQNSILKSALPDLVQLIEVTLHVIKKQDDSEEKQRQLYESIVKTWFKSDIASTDTDADTGTSTEK